MIRRNHGVSFDRFKTKPRAQILAMTLTHFMCKFHLRRIMNRLKMNIAYLRKRYIGYIQAVLSNKATFSVA